MTCLSLQNIFPVLVVQTACQKMKFQPFAGKIRNGDDGFDSVREDLPREPRPCGEGGFEPFGVVEHTRVVDGDHLIFYEPRPRIGG